MIALPFNAIVDNAYAQQYSNSQSQSFVNECGVGEPTAINCANNGPMIQGDGTATALTPSQISNPTVVESPKQVLQVRERNGDTVTVPAGGAVGAKASCAPDEVATGGGMTLSSSPGNTINSDQESEHSTTGSSSNPPTDWQYGYTNKGPNSVDITASVICAKLVDAP